MMMTRRKTIVALLAAFTFQFAVMVGVFLNGHYPIWTGQEIRIATEPFDPRDLFRGNYARLRYAFDDLHAADFAPGDVAYLMLEKVQEGDAAPLWRGVKLVKTEPESGLFLRGRVKGGWRGRKYVLYGIDAFFAPKEKALALERDLRGGGGVAVIRVAPNGKAALVSVVPVERE